MMRTSPPTRERKKMSNQAARIIIYSATERGVNLLRYELVMHLIDLQRWTYVMNS